MVADEEEEEVRGTSDGWSKSMKPLISMMDPPLVREELLSVLLIWCTFL